MGLILLFVIMCMASFILGAIAVRRVYQLYCTTMILKLTEKLSNHMDISLIERLFREAEQELRAEYDGDVDKKS